MIKICGLSFSYPGSDSKILENLNLDIEPGSRVVLTGLNGAGKSTLLSIIAGQKMVEPGVIAVLDMDPFRDLKCSGRIQFVTSNWVDNIPSLGSQLIVSDLLNGVISDTTADFHNPIRMMSLLGVNPKWKVSAVSEGQRRRIQLLLKLVKKASVILLDEATTGAVLTHSAELARLYPNHSVPVDCRSGPDCPAQSSQLSARGKRAAPGHHCLLHPYLRRPRRLGDPSRLHRWPPAHPL
jgi:CCR4-NOT complex subunit CAF16